MAFIMFGNGRELLLKIGEPNALFKGAGIHRLQFPVEIDSRHTIGPAVAFAIGGNAWLGQAGGDWLGPWFPDPSQQSVTYDDPFSATFILPLTDEQLAVIEQRRAGSDLRFAFDIQVALGYDPAVADKAADDRWPTKAFQDAVHVHAATWVRMLSQVNTGTSLAIVLPVPLDYTAAARVGAHLRAAISKVNNNDCDGAVTEARRAIDALSEIRPAWPPEKAVTPTDSRERTFDQRLAMLKHALFGLASPAAHGDKVAASIKWNRETALAVIAGVAALAACGGPEK